MPVFLIAQGIYAAADKRVRVIAGRPERGYAADGADQGLGCVGLDLELARQNECQAVEHAERDHQLQQTGLASASPNRVGQPRRATAPPPSPGTKEIGYPYIQVQAQPEESRRQAGGRHQRDAAAARTASARMASSVSRSSS